MSATEQSIEFNTGAQSPLSFMLSETDIRGNRWREGIRLTVIQDESDSFHGSNLTREQALELSTWLHNALVNWET